MVFGIAVSRWRLAVDRGRWVDEDAQEAALENAAKQVSTAVIRDQEVGVKWDVQRGWAASLSRKACASVLKLLDKEWLGIDKRHRAHTKRTWRMHW